MKTNNKFSFKRVAQYIKFDFMSNIKDYMARLLIMTILMLLTMILTSLANADSDNMFFSDDYEAYLGTISTFAVIVLYVGLSVSLSLICEPLKNIGRRINHFMLPASTLEKYLGRLIISTVGFFIAFNVAILTADIIRNIAMLSFGFKYSSMVGFSYLEIIKRVLTFSPSTLATLMMIFDILVFLLGGVIWYNYSFIKTLTAKTVIGLVITIMVGFCSGIIVNLALNIDFYSISVDYLENISISIISIINIAIIITAYFIYRKAQIAPKRFIFKR